MAPRLKVFVTSDGLTDYVVAATSKTKALAAWGVHQDVFKTGLAHETNDADLVAAASERPGEVVRRPSDATGALAKLKPAKASAKPKGPSKAALKKVEDLERRLTELDEIHRGALADIARDRAELDRREAAEAAAYADKRDRIEAALSAARRAPG